jgi:hypothetical protein
MSKVRSPLEPLSAVTRMSLVVLGIIAVCGVGATIGGSGSFLGWGARAVCVDNPDGRVMPSTSSVRGQVIVSVPEVHLCTDSPDVAQRVWYTLTELPDALVLIVALLLIYSMIRRAASRGVYTAQVAARLRLLGWWLVIASVVAGATEQVAQARLVATMITRPVGWLVPGAPPWTAVLTGVGVLTFARITRLGANMRDELAAVV